MIELCYPLERRSDKRICAVRHIARIFRPRVHVPVDELEVVEGQAMRTKYSVRLATERDGCIVAVGDAPLVIIREGLRWSLCVTIDGGHRLIARATMWTAVSDAAKAFAQVLVVHV